MSRDAFEALSLLTLNNSLRPICLSSSACHMLELHWPCRDTENKISGKCWGSYSKMQQPTTAWLILNDLNQSTYIPIPNSKLL